MLKHCPILKYEYKDIKANRGQKYEATEAKNTD